MTDFILAGLSAGLFAFCALFVVSFVVLGLITGAIHVAALVYRNLVSGKNQPYQEQAV
ncbi:hypothetical protein DSCA_38810 [Desulfosarcina alkanivorans]|jgi:hypothetical protein|uniref:Uncharacterized protein n=1 Tax=Desulfosarcina alkanivorans TaxID=571177 RepID=A0A5K7YSJ2_9BACT|nr:hypothetical protein [Desulfosarcina alkanivorans]BBO69951.1 hypothetical protein DSCA_38810 [Desulfosarcina alkanivorans]